MNKQYWQWRYRKARLRLKRRLYSLLYQDNYPNIERTILVAGTGRSGTTWLGDLIAAPYSCRIMFEPFYAGKVPAFNQFAYFQYMRPQEANPDLYAVCQTVFTGQIRDPWIDHQIEVLRPRCRLIKEIRANLFLKWLHVQFPTIPILFIIRHPCAVVASRMQLGWATDGDLQPMLAQEKLVTDYLANQMNSIYQANTPESKHALIWCISNLIPLRQFAPGEIKIVFYEHLCTQPEVEIPAIFAALGLDVPAAIQTQLKTPSTTSLPDSAIVTGANQLDRWQTYLNSEQVRRIMAIVTAFGLDYLYGDSLTPQVTTGFR
ncbi:MAG: sulfotransferase [Anaerolineae bacterium]|nr:sulfotransferase [Anaerolineae bacterium]